MGNFTGAGLGATIGLIGGPVGALIGAAVGGALGTGVEIANAIGIPSMEGDGGHHLGPIRAYHNHRIDWIVLARCNLTLSALNKTGTAARVVLAPVSTIISGVYRLEHYWIIMKLDNGLYITIYRSDQGIFAEIHHSWDDCFMPENCGAKKGRRNGKVFKPRWQDCNARNRKVIDFVCKAQSLPSYYSLNDFEHNCQGYANAIKKWC